MVDVDKKDFVSAARAAQEQVTRNARPRQEVKLHFDKRAKVHFSHMLKAVGFMAQPLPRCLDQSYHDDLDNEKLDFLNNDQVVVRYIQYIKAKSSRILAEMGYTTGNHLSGTDQRTTVPAQYEQGDQETEPAPQLDQHQQRANTQGGLPEDDRTPTQDSQTPGRRGPQPLEQTSFEVPRAPCSPRRTYTGASTTSQPRRFSIQRSDTEASISPEDAKKLFESMQSDAVNQKQMAQSGHPFMLSGVGPTLAPVIAPKSPIQTEHRAGLATPTPVTPGTPGTLVKELADIGDEDDENIGATGPAIVSETISLEESDDFLTVPYFWLFKIDAGKAHPTACPVLFFTLDTDDIHRHDSHRIS